MTWQVITDKPKLCILKYFHRDGAETTRWLRVENMHDHYRDFPKTYKAFK